MRIARLLFGGCGLLAGILQGQSVLSIVSGRVTDAAGVPLPGAVVHYRAAELAVEGSVPCQADGRFTLLMLPPGRYTIEATAPGYQNLEINDMALPVSSLLNLPIRLRSLQDLWERSQHQIFLLPNSDLVKFYGPDVDTSRSVHVMPPDSQQQELEATMSYVVSRQLIDDLPLAGRDVYSVLLVEPAVTADLTASRGIGLSVAGQRPASSNFMLDGLENNNYAITGPLFPLAPEAIQEYRVSTNNYSAEFGRTSGYLANAVTRAGTAQWHGVGYLNAQTSALNANDFQSHATGTPKPQGNQFEPGGQVGGPLRRDRLFLSLAFDLLHSADILQGGPQSFVLPDQALYQQLESQPALTAGQQLLLQYRPSVIPVGQGNGLVAPVKLVPPVTLSQQVGEGRVDFTPPFSRHKLMGRVAVAHSSRPDYNWSPYPAFTSGLDSNVASAAVAATSTFSTNKVNDFRAGWSQAGLTLGRPNSNLPLLSSGDGATLPGLVSSTAYRNRNRAWEFNDNLLWTAGRHILKFGGGLLLRRIDLEYHFADRGLVDYSNISSFLSDQPSLFYSTFSRQNFAAQQLFLPPTVGRYGQQQFDLFAQDSFRVTSRLTLNGGVRLDDFGSPHFVGNPPPQVILGPGADIQSRIAAAQLQFAPTPGNRLYNSPGPNLAGRAGFAWQPGASGNLVLRGSYGMFFDRPFDNIWLDVQSNAWLLGSARISGTTFDPRTGIAALLPNTNYGAVTPDTDFSNLTLVQPNLRSAYAQSFFLGAQQRLRRNFYLEVNGLGTQGRQLLTNDIVNRHFSDPLQFGAPGNPLAQLNGSIPQLQYRANQGSSTYTALAVLLRYSSGHAQFQGAYTWSHSIDNQSEPLIGDFTDLRPGTPSPEVSAFPLQFHSSMDRGNSDFDQRQTLTFYASWDSGRAIFGSRLSHILREWHFAALGSLRSGFPYSVTATTLFSPALALSQCIGANVVLTPGCNGEVLGGRADMLTTAIYSTQTVPGGRILLRSAAFGPPAPNLSGNTARNEFTGPGAASLDLSAGRWFPTPWLGEAGHIEIRADAYNALNHANLGQPNGDLDSPSFGVALYGVGQPRTGLLPVVPLRESPRQIELRLRVVF